MALSGHSVVDEKAGVLPFLESCPKDLLVGMYLLITKFLNLFFYSANWYFNKKILDLILWYTVYTPKKGHFG